MAWAAERQTTREEDSAYCHLGLFNVNMPFLYGEGSKACLRFQEEIMKVSTDLSILLWQGNASPMNGMLAAAPSSFEKDGRNPLDLPMHKKTLFLVHMLKHRSCAHGNFRILKRRWHKCIKYVK